MTNTILDTTSFYSLDKAPALNKAKANEAAENFEAFFISKSMESMYEGIETDGPFGGGQAEKIYRSLLVDEYGNLMAQSGGIGIKESVMDTMLKMQGEQSYE